MSGRRARLMVIAAHPQDPYERAGGTSANHLERGDEVMFVSLTSGAITHAYNVFPPTGDDKLRDMETVKARKRGEFEDAARILGLTDTRMFDFPESPLVVGLAEHVALVDLIREFRPTVVLCPHPTEFGRFDHMDAGRVVVAAVDYARADGFPSSLAPHTVADLFLFYYEDVRTETFMGAPRHAGEVAIDITGVVDKKRAAMAIFGRTQAKAGQDYAKMLDGFFASVDGAAGYALGTGYVERFVRLNPVLGRHLPLSAP